MKRHHRGHSGFTLIELLVVIAIIAILSGILFPVLSAVRKKAKQSKCDTQLRQIVQALKMYKQDHGVYPDALAQYAWDSDGDGTIDKVENRLFPGQLDSPSSFTCPLSEIRPNGGDWGPQTPAVGNWVQPLDKSVGVGTPRVYPLGDTYDMQLFPNQFAPAPAWELHYNTRWTGNINNFSNDRRLLAFRDPSEQTVVTWCLYHAKIDDAGVPKKGHLALVAFLDGRVQTIPVEKMLTWTPPAPGLPDPRPFMVLPKP